MLKEPPFDRLPLCRRDHSLPAYASRSGVVHGHEVMVGVENVDRFTVINTLAVIGIVDFVMVILHLLIV